MGALNIEDFLESPLSQLYGIEGFKGGSQRSQSQYYGIEGFKRAFQSPRFQHYGIEEFQGGSQ